MESRRVRGASLAQALVRADDPVDADRETRLAYYRDLAASCDEQAGTEREALVAGRLRSLAREARWAAEDLVSGLDWAEQERRADRRG